MGYAYGITKFSASRDFGQFDLLVIEILSPGNSKKEMRLKYELYEENGVREYWIVYPETKSIQVFILNENHKFIGLRPQTDDEILTSTLFPDLSVDLGEVFKNI